MANGNALMERWMKEQRAENFHRTFEPVPMVPDAQLEVRVGERIGSGTTHEVYEDQEHTTRVIKRAWEGDVGANWVEYFVWTAARDTRWANVIAQCFAISESGRFLSMERIQAPIQLTQYPDVPDLPWWLDDLQPKNFGVAADGTVKVCDYALVGLGFDMDEALPHRPSFAWPAES
jgi:hypothetical protein